MDYEKARKEMVRLQLENRGIKKARVLEAMGKIPREDFLPAKSKDLAYIDAPLAISSCQTISQPYIVALILEALDLQGTERALEIGTGSGYSTAVLAELTDSVVSLERDKTLYQEASERLQGVDVTLVLGDGSLGYPGQFDAIAVHAGAPEIPQSLLRSLAPEGRMVIPLREGENERLHLIKKDSSGKISDTALDFCKFVPLIGEEAY